MVACVSISTGEMTAHRRALTEEMASHPRDLEDIESVLRSEGWNGARVDIFLLIGGSFEHPLARLKVPEFDYFSQPEAFSFEDFYVRFLHPLSRTTFRFKFLLKIRDSHRDLRDQILETWSWEMHGLYRCRDHGW